MGELPLTQRISTASAQQVTEQIKQEAQLLQSTSKSVGEIISGLKPDVILLSTPHGIADLDRFLFYLGAKGYGSADTDNYAGPYQLTVDLDSISSQSLVRELVKLGENVSGLSAFGPPGGADDPFPLRLFIPYIFQSTVVAVCS